MWLQELFTWDKGNQLTYPVRYHDSGYNSTKDDKNDSSSASAHVQTGFDIEATSEAPYPDNPYDN